MGPLPCGVIVCVGPEVARRQCSAAREAAGSGSSGAIRHLSPECGRTQAPTMPGPYNPSRGGPCPGGVAEGAVVSGGRM